MGPLILFDKSALQALSLNESVWLDHFFLSIIAPLFFVETLADLEKEVPGRTPEEEVKLIAAKTPETSSYPNVFHLELCLQNLLGERVPMEGRAILAGGIPVRSYSRSGLRFNVAPEAVALERWQAGQFLEVERQFAKHWRSSLGTLDPCGVIQRLNELGVVPGKCRNLEEAKSMADAIVNQKDRPLEILALVFSLLGLPGELFLSVFQRYRMAGYPTLAAFAPYTAYVLAIEVFFYIAAYKSFISLGRISNKVDISYLCYLPFCMVFTSSDRLHRRCAPLFLRDDQEFIWGADLKEDLKKIDEYFDQLPDSEKEKGLNIIAPHPPKEGNFLVSSLWDRHLRPWRSRPEISLSADQKTRLFKQLREFNEARPLRLEEMDFEPSNAETVSIQRRIQRRKGKWWQVPKDLEQV
jgi:hypothetical protein